MFFSSNDLGFLERRLERLLLGSLGNLLLLRVQLSSNNLDFVSLQSECISNWL